MESNLVCCRTSNEGLNMVSGSDVVGGKSLVRSEMERENEGWKSNKIGCCSVIEMLKYGGICIIDLLLIIFNRCMGVSCNKGVEEGLHHAHLQMRKVKEVNM